MSDKESEPESIILNGNAYNEIRLTDVKEIQIIGDDNFLFRCLSLFKYILKNQINLMKITQLDIKNLYFQLKR